jgi:hypothetical protein
VIAEGAMWMATGERPAPRDRGGDADSIKVVLDRLDDALPEENVFSWLMTPHPELGGAAPMAALAAGDLEVVLRIV